jgi:hypothetical protein
MPAKKMLLLTLNKFFIHKHNKRIKEMSNSDSKNSDSIKKDDLIQLAGSLCMGVTSFLGLNYWLGDNVLAVSLSAGILVLAAVYGLVHMLVKAKKADENKDRARKVEIATLIGYAIVAILAGIFMLHYLTVEMKKKTEIKDAAITSINQINIISTGYEEQVNKWSAIFREKLKIAVDKPNDSIYKKYLSKYTYIDNDIIDTIVKDNLTDKIKEIDLTQRKYAIIEADATNFMKRALSAVGAWNYFSIMNTLTQIDKVKKSYIDDLTALSKQIHEETKDTFTPPVIINMSDKLSELEEIDFANGIYGLWIVVFAIINLMTLYPYLFEKRKGLIDNDRKFNTNNDSFSV